LLCCIRRVSTSSIGVAQEQMLNKVEQKKLFLG
jgi:hypothetical protein